MVPRPRKPRYFDCAARSGFAATANSGWSLAAESGREQALFDSREVGGDIGRTDDLDSIIDNVTFADQQAIADTARTLDRGALAAAVDLVLLARRIDVVGVGASAVVALDLQQKLHRIGLIAFAWSDTHAALTAAALLGPEDVLIGISHSGATKDTEEAVEEAARRGAAHDRTDQRSALSAGPKRQRAVGDRGTGDHLPIWGDHLPDRRIDRCRRAVRRGRPPALRRHRPGPGRNPEGSHATPFRAVCWSAVNPRRVRVSSPTEHVNPRTENIDEIGTLEILRLINAEDALVPAAVAVLLPTLAELVDQAVVRIGAGGRVHYFGAGTSGRPRGARRR